MDLDHLREAGDLGQHQVVGQQNGEGLVTDQVPGAPDRVTETERLLLWRV
jgi:hypothetical protein